MVPGGPFPWDIPQSQVDLEHPSELLLCDSWDGLEWSPRVCQEPPGTPLALEVGNAAGLGWAARKHFSIQNQTQSCNSLLELEFPLLRLVPAFPRPRLTLGQDLSRAGGVWLCLPFPAGI